ncbi:hypothetical protein DIPPA_11438 [Diplonema papillatum]|nr:hypothetical protein DIPPA_11438 [Diplonema papillatum]|eukprot:gene16693-25623_t
MPGGWVTELRPPTACTTTHTRRRSASVAAGGGAGDDDDDVGKLREKDALQKRLVNTLRREVVLLETEVARLRQQGGDTPNVTPIPRCADEERVVTEEDARLYRACLGGSAPHPVFRADAGGSVRAVMSTSRAETLPQTPRPARPVPLAADGTPRHSGRRSTSQSSPQPTVFNTPRTRMRDRRANRPRVDVGQSPRARSTSQPAAHAPRTPAKALPDTLLRAVTQQHGSLRAAYTNLQARLPPTHPFDSDDYLDVVHHRACQLLSFSLQSGHRGLPVAALTSFDAFKQAVAEGGVPLASPEQQGEWQAAAEQAAKLEALLASRKASHAHAVAALQQMIDSEEAAYTHLAAELAAA